MFWQLTEKLAIEILAPTRIIDTLKSSLLLQTSSSLSTQRIIPLEWNEEHYTTYYQEYWNPTYGEKDNVVANKDDGFFLIGKGFFLSYSISSDKACFFITDNLILDYLVFSYPFSKLLVYLLNREGYSPLHAAVIGNNSGYVMIPGKQFSGKSTTAATWVLNGGSLLSDDTCFVNTNCGNQIIGHYPSLRLREKSFSLFGDKLDRTQLKQKDQSKYFYLLQEQRPQQFTSVASVKAIFCLELHEDEPSYEIVNPSTGFNYLASSLAFSSQHGADNRLCLKTIRSLVTVLPIYKVKLSPNLDINYHFLDQLISSITPLDLK
jgi:hypothetical protein